MEPNIISEISNKIQIAAMRQKDVADEVEVDEVEEEEAVEEEIRTRK